MRFIYKSTAVFALLPALVLLLSLNLSAEDKKITKIYGLTSADGKSHVSKELLEECIDAMPAPANLVAVTNSSTQFMKGINGDDKQKDHVKSYSATVDVNYMLYQKELIIITTNSIGGTKPVLEEKVLRIKQSKSFHSKSANGNMFAGRSKRQYYFSSEAAAVKDAKQQASAWIKSQSAVICKK